VKCRLDSPVHIIFLHLRQPAKRQNRDRKNSTSNVVGKVGCGVAVKTATPATYLSKHHSYLPFGYRLQCLVTLGFRWLGAYHIGVMGVIGSVEADTIITVLAVATLIFAPGVYVMEADVKILNTAGSNVRSIKKVPLLIAARRQRPKQFA